MKHNRIGIRTDASPQLGMGHVMRCISIAQALSAIDVESIFICANDYPTETVLAYGFEISVLNSDYKMMESEVIPMLEAVNQLKLSGILVDSYYATDYYLSCLQERVPVVYIDGLYRCQADITGIINYNAAANIEEYRKRFERKKTALMIGLDFTPLRNEFKMKSGNKLIRKKVDSILLTTGATDNYGVVVKLCRYWKKTDLLKDVEKHIIVGKLFKEPEKLMEDFADDSSFVFHQNTTNMRSHMKNADIAISAAGTTVYELLSMQVPSVIFSLADIQNTVGILSPAINWVGDIRDNAQKDSLSAEATERITNAVRELMNSYTERKAISELARKCVDGEGADRLARRILEAIQK